MIARRRTRVGALLRRAGLASPARVWALLGVVIVVSGGLASPAHAEEGALSMEDAVRVALERNREVIAARLDIEAAQLDVVAARLYPNPIASYAIGNLVLGHGNSQGVIAGGAPL